MNYVIIMPARNEASHFQKTIDSVAAQTLRSFVVRWSFLR